ncbi:hypothetical protein AWC38_SpisGene17993 [Stylophora pistillata]|uniref:Uncharacterized protein n=1 Tax=Stylophora pistillata TaxID=50429 RepID=A0A2B4RN22_STYPI|nr:hypothetical protein AWC38_SpisGene17993 [Stylophora pistillata]
MAEGRLQHKANGRLRWSEQMNSDLLECKKMALELMNSNNPPRLESRRKNNVITVLMEREKATPTDNPFVYIWLADCILYSVAAAFLVFKGWKKNPKDKATKEIRDSENWKRASLESVRDGRKKISKATAELERLKKYWKLTKKGKKNRALLQKECGLSSLVSCIERQKSVLRKLKASFGRRKRLEEAKELNRRFTEDPGRVYTTITKIVAEEPDTARPKYKKECEDQDTANKGVFSDITEAEGFWRALWEENGSGDENTEWLEERWRLHLVFVASEEKLNRVLKMAKTVVENVGLQWNPKNCNVLDARHGVVSETSNGFTDGQAAINCLKEDAQYRFLGTPECLLQEDKLALDIAARAYLQRLSVIWSSPLSDKNKVTATNQLALPLLSYLMWSQQWCVTDLRNTNRESRKIICRKWRKAPTWVNCTPAAVKLYGKEDPTMGLVRAFEEQAAVKGHRLLVKEAGKFAEELGVSLNLSYPSPKLYDEEGKEVSKEKIKDKL